MENANIAPDENVNEETKAERLFQNINHLLIELRLEIVTELVEKAKAMLISAKDPAERAEAMKAYQSHRQTQNYISQLVGRNK